MIIARRRRAAVTLAAALLAAPVSARAQAGTGGAPVHVGFRAIGDDGQAVTDLKAAELLLKVNGKPRTIQSLTVFQSSAAAIAASTPLPPPYATNTSGDGGRIIHILIDDDSIAPGRETPIRDAVRLLSTELSPSDRLGVLTPQGTVNVPPTTDPSKVRLAVNGLAGRASSTETDGDAQCRTTRVLQALGTMIALTRDRPTTLVIFSGGLTPPATKMVAIGRGSDLCPVRAEDFQNLGSLAATATADLYLIHVPDAVPNRSSTQDAGVESVAGATGGEYLELSGEPHAMVSRLLRETSAYYVVTFEPEPGERNGTSQRLELRTTRDKVKLRARPAVMLAKEVAPKSVAPKDMLRVAVEYRDLPLRSTAYASRMPKSSDVRVVALFEPLDAAGTLTAASVGLFDANGSLKAQWTAQKEDLARRPVRADLQVPAGTYRVRVAAIDTGGRAGATDEDVKAEAVRADPLTLSALVVGTQAQGGGFAPRLEFSNETVALGLVEIYGVPKSGALAVTLDVVSTPEGQPLATAETTIGRGPFEDSRTAIGGFGIGNLPPGDYLMRAVVSLDGRPVGKAVKTLRKAR